MTITWRDQPILDSVQLPGAETKYWVADSEAREKIEALTNATHFIGVSSTEITDGGIQKPTISGQQVNQETGDIVIYKVNRGTELNPVWVPLEFIWDGSAWQLLGDQSFDHLGDLAYKDSASGSYTPEGSVNLTPATMAVVISVSHDFEVEADFAGKSGSGLVDSVTLDFSGSLTTSSVSYFGSSQALEYINLASVNQRGDSYVGVVTDISFQSTAVVNGIVPGALPTISNTNTITATMGTGSSSTTLIFSLSDIGFNQGTQPRISYSDVINTVASEYAEVSFLTLSPETVGIPYDVTGTTSLYYSVSLIGNVETTTDSALSGVTATFAGTASTITVS